MSFQFHSIIARLIIVIDIAPLMMLFCNCLLFCNCPLVDCNCLLLKYISFNTKCFYRWFLCSANFWDKSPLQYLEILKLPLFYSGNFKIFKNALGQFIQNCPPKHMITSRNYCPHISMFCSRTSNDMINEILKRTLILLLNDHTSDFDKLLQNNSDTCNHHRNIQTPESSNYGLCVWKEK